MKKEIKIGKSTTFPCDVVEFKNINFKLESGYLLNNFNINF